MSTITITPVTGDDYQVQTIIADQVAYSNKRRQAKWPALQEDPLLAQNYIAFAAARREGKFTGTWDDFGLQTVEVTEEIDDEEEVIVDGEGNRVVSVLPDPTPTTTPLTPSPPSPSASESPRASF